MKLRTQRMVDTYVGGLAIAALRPATKLLGAILRRNHALTVGKEIVWIKMLGGGSLLLATPMLLGFRRAFPGVKMVLVTTPAVKPFAELTGVFDEYRVIDQRGTLRPFASAFKALLKTWRADCVIDLEAYSRLTTVFTTLTMARNRISFWLEDIFWRRGLSSHLVFFNRSSPSYVFYDRIGDLFGVKAASHDETRAAVLAACGIADVPGVSGQVAVGFACSDLAYERMLTPEQWIQVFRDNLRPEHRTFLFLGGAGDRVKGQAIIDAVRPHFPGIELRNCCGDMTLAQSMGAIVGSSEFWGIDSGLVHLARIAGVRCVSYWGPTDPSTLLRPTPGLVETIHYRKIACSPCVHSSETPPCRGDNRCIQGLFAGPATSPTTWTPVEFPPERPPLGYRGVLAALGRNIGFIAVAIVLIYCIVGAFDPPRLNWGDSASDFNAMSSGRNFDEYGFIKLRLTPVVFDLAAMTPQDSSLVYTHYPQLPDLMNGLERRLFGFTDIVQFRFVALAFSFASLFFVYWLVRAYWSRQTAQIALALWVLNPLWIQHADYLHHAPYAAFFGFGSLYFLTRYLREGNRGLHLAMAGVFLFFVYESSYDFWIFIPAMMAMITMAHYRAVFSVPVWRTLGILAGCAVFALMAKWATNIWVLRGFSNFLIDLRYQFAERATDDVTRTYWVSGIWPTTYGRVERCFSGLLFPVALFWALRPIIKRRWGTRWPTLQGAGPNPFWILAAAVPFLLIFTELFIGQYYPTLLILPFYAVACAALASLLIDSGRLPRLVGIAMVVALFANAANETLSFKKAFLSRDMIRTLKPQLDSLAPAKQVVLTNHVFDAAYRYYFHRNSMAMVLFPPGRVNVALEYYADPKRPRFASSNGAVFVQHKHIKDELFDKGYYYIFSRYRLWRMWANPTLYRSFVDSLVMDRDSTLMASIAQVGDKLYENDDYSLWRIRPQMQLYRPKQEDFDRPSRPGPFRRN
jgi:ADP-heptose:LPS heptosyltransferase